MKITSHSLVASMTVRPQLKNVGAESAKTSAVPSSEPAGPISQAQQTLREMPDVDTQRVADLKAAIRNGELDLDADSLSRSMMDYYRR